MRANAAARAHCGAAMRFPTSRWAEQRRRARNVDARNRIHGTTGANCLAPRPPPIFERHVLAAGAAGGGRLRHGRRARENAAPVGRLALFPGMHRLHGIAVAILFADAGKPDLRCRFARLPPHIAGGFRRRRRTGARRRGDGEQGQIHPRRRRRRLDEGRRPLLDHRRRRQSRHAARARQGRQGDRRCRDLRGLRRHRQGEAESDRRRGRAGDRLRQAADQCLRLPARSRGHRRRARASRRFRQTAGARSPQTAGRLLPRDHPPALLSPPLLSRRAFREEF